ncbi:MAG: DUF2436 domain-containing protein [Bacteroidales bacterium]|nr:DUF2436 domain-containing protein [Bacteroidales bacterium]
MKRLLLICICALSVFGLSAQISENFSDYTVGGKIAQQAQEMGRDYWTTWSSAPGGAEDGSVASLEGQNVASLVGNNDQVLLFGEETTGEWNIEFDMYVPTGKVGYFNVLADFAASSSVWAMQAYVNATNDGTNTTYAAGQGTLHAGANGAATFTCVHDAWMHFQVIVNLNADLGTFFVNGEQIHQWQWSLGSFGEDNLRQLEAMNIYCDPSANMEFYADNFSYSSNTAAQTIFEANFDEATANQYLGVLYPEFWTTWSNAPGGTEDGVISTDYANTTPNSAKFVYGNDVVFLAGDKTTGSYTIDLDVFIPTGKNGYFNLLHAFAGTSSEHGCEFYFNEPTEGTKYVVGGVDYTFTPIINEWFNVHFDINLDGDWIQFKINDELIGEWQYSIQAGTNAPGLRQLGAMDFFPPTNANSVFYIDNFQYTSLGGESYPDVQVTPTSISSSLAPGQVEDQTVTVTNEGTSIGDYFSWITYDAATGATGTQEHTLTYSSDVPTNSVGFSTGTPLVELGAKFTGAFYGPFMNTEITQLSYFAANDAISGGITFRVYGQGTYGNPGEVLAETSITSYTPEAWNSVTFSEPVLLTGEDVWVVVEFTQTAGGYPLSFDDGVGEDNTDWYRINGGAWGQFHLGENNWGNVMIKATTVGTPIPGSWAVLSGSSYGSILAGNTLTYDVAMNAAGLTQNTYNATLHVLTNNAENPQFDIPITLDVVTSDCEVPTNLVATSDQNAMKVDLTWDYDEPIPGDMAAIILEANDVWGEGTGYQILLDADHNTSANITGNFTCGQSYAEYEYMIPTNATAADDYVIVSGSESIQIPAGVYDYVVLNPGCNSFGTVYVASDQCDASVGSSVTFEAGQIYHFTATLQGSNDCITITNTAKTRDDVTFNVYRDGVKVAEGISELAYTDANLDAGNYCYTVTTSCPAGEGLHSNQSCAELLEPCFAPEVTAIGESENDLPAIHLTWNAVEGATQYKVYYGTTNVSTTTETSVYITGLQANTEYCFTVKTICGNGLTSVASEEACATYTNVEEIENNFNIFPNPANKQVKVDGENINQISIYNMVGQLVETTQSTTINTASYNNGIYVIRILTNEGNVVTKRVVINH